MALPTRVNRGATIDPFDVLHREFDGMLHRLVNGETNGGRNVARWAPYAVDVREDADHFYVDAELPGFRKEEIDITMENGVLSLRGRRSHEKTTDEKGFRRIERSSGEFFRRFTLPDVADSEQISAQTNNGVLTVRIAKRAEVQPKKIEIKAS